MTLSPIWQFWEGDADPPDLIAFCMATVAAALVLEALVAYVGRWWWKRRHPNVSPDNLLVHARFDRLAFPDEFARVQEAISSGNFKMVRCEKCGRNQIQIVEPEASMPATEYVGAFVHDASLPPIKAVLPKAAAPAMPETTERKP